MSVGPIRDDFGLCIRVTSVVDFPLEILRDVFVHYRQHVGVNLSPTFGELVSQPMVFNAKQLRAHGFDEVFCSCLEEFLYHD